MKTKINIGGDFCITSQYVSKTLFSKEITELFKKSDINIVNLECPIIEGSEVKIIKTGPHLYSTEEIFEQLKAINVHIVALANNHILDFGEKGLESTFESCRRNSISFVGAGSSLTEATFPVIVESNGVRVGFVNFCENEWSVATDKSGGANPLDLIENLKQIRLAREMADFVLVIIHGGHEFYNLPSPRMLKTYRFFAENGADAVIGHHTHCISGYEIHKNIPIFYSLGNMIFTKPEKSEEWYKGIILQLTLETGKPIHFELHPIMQSQKDYKLTLSENAQKENVLSEVKAFSDIICNKIELEKKWDFFISSKKRNINYFSPISFIPGKYLQAALYRLGINKIFMRKQGLIQILNNIRCEAHRDITISVLNNTILKK